MDWISVRTLIETYMQSVDLKDRAMMAGTFAADAEAVYHAGTPQERSTHGGAIIVDEILRNIRHFVSSNHSISNFTVRVEDGVAHADTFAIASCNLDDGRLVMRGLRYQDTVRPSGTGLVIGRRIHTPLWQAELPSVAPRI